MTDKRAFDALENCRLYAAKHRSEEWAKTILRFCDEGGASGSPLRDDAGREVEFSCPRLGYYTHPAPKAVKLPERKEYSADDTAQGVRYKDGWNACLDALAASPARGGEGEKDAEKMEDALEQIKQWAQAYPLTVFPEPNFAKAHELLQAGGMTLDAISASNMRHVITQVQKIVDAAMSREAQG